MSEIVETQEYYFSARESIGFFQNEYEALNNEMPRYYETSTSNGNARVHKEERLSSSEYIGDDWDFSWVEDTGYVENEDLDFDSIEIASSSQPVEYVGDNWDFPGLENLMSSTQGDCHGDCDVYNSHDDYYRHAKDGLEMLAITMKSSLDDT